MQNFPSCRNVFQGGAQPDVSACTRAWIRLLDAMERARALPDGASPEAPAAGQTSGLPGPEQAP